MYNLGVKMNKNTNNVKIIKRYSEELKRKVVSEVESGIYNMREAAELYGLSDSRTVSGWVKKYGKNPSKTKIVRITMKDEAEKLRDLEKALAEEKLRTMLYKAELECYEKELPDIKKKLSMKQLKKFEEIQKKRLMYT